MRYFAVVVSIVLWAGTASATTLFDGSFVGCTDGNACNTGTGWDTETDTGGDVACDDNDNITLHVDNRVCQVVMNDTTAGLVEEDTAFSTENEVYGRFYLHIAVDGTYPASNNFSLLRARNEADDNTVFELRLNATAGGRFNMSALIDQDSGTDLFPTQVGFLNPGEWNCVQFHWKASSGVGANDGISKHWVNGRIGQTMTTVDNDTRDWGETQIGDIAGIDATPAMTMYIAEAIFDDATLPACTGMPPKPSVSVENVGDMAVRH